MGKIFPNHTGTHTRISYFIYSYVLFFFEDEEEGFMCHIYSTVKFFIHISQLARKMGSERRVSHDTVEHPWNKKG